MEKSSKKLLKQILTELDEEELLAVPPDEEIRKKHIFSGRFLRNMKPVLAMGTQDSGKVRRKQRNIRILAACIACVLVFGGILAAWSGTFSLRMGSSSNSNDVASADLGMYGTDTEETADKSTTSYAVEDIETEEVAEESASDSAASGSTDVGTLTDADAAGAAEGTETDGSSETASDSSYEQKLIRTVNLSAETTDFDNLVAGVKAKTEELGGYVESSEMNTSTDSTSRWAYLTLRVPAEKLDDFVAQVNEDANVTYSGESTEDVTLTYTDLESHVAALRTEQETLLSMLEQAMTMEDILAIQSQLTEVRYEIESYESQLKVYDNQVTYSTVYLDISEVTRESTGTGITFAQQVGNRFSDSLYNIANGLRKFVIGFLGAIPYFVLVAVVVAVVIFIWKKVRMFTRKSQDGRKINTKS